MIKPLLDKIKKKEICDRLAKNYLDKQIKIEQILINLRKVDYSDIYYNDFKKFPYIYYKIKYKENKCEINAYGDIVDNIIIIGKNIDKISISNSNIEIYKKYCNKVNYCNIQDINLNMLLGFNRNFIYIRGDNIEVYCRFRLLPNEHRKKLCIEGFYEQHPYLKDKCIEWTTMGVKIQDVS